MLFRLKSLDLSLLLKFKLISAVIRYFSGGIKERRHIGYQFCQPLCQADVASTLFINDFWRYAESNS